jgi:hypothetical protein
VPTPEPERLQSVLRHAALLHVAGRHRRIFDEIRSNIFYFGVILEAGSMAIGNQIAALQHRRPLFL